MMPSEINASTDVENVAIKVNTPSRVIHFSDGIIEEFSEEEVDEVDPAPPLPVDEGQMTWGPWLAHKAISTSTVVLAKCDAMGESIAEFLGITTPKYSYELRAHQRMLAEQARVAKEDMDSASWSEISQLDGDPAVIVEGPSAVANNDLQQPQKY